MCNVHGRLCIVLLSSFEFSDSILVNKAFVCVPSTLDYNGFPLSHLSAWILIFNIGGSVMKRCFEIFEALMSPLVFGMQGGHQEEFFACS